MPGRGPGLPPGFFFFPWKKKILPWKKRGFCPKSARERKIVPVKIFVKIPPVKKIGAREKFWAIFPAKMITFLINSARETDLCTREENGKKPKKVPVKQFFHPWRKSKKWAKMTFTGTFGFHGEKKRPWVERYENLKFWLQITTWNPTLLAWFFKNTFPHKNFENKILTHQLDIKFWNP